MDSGNADVVSVSEASTQDAGGGGKKKGGSDAASDLAMSKKKLKVLK